MLNFLNESTDTGLAVSYSYNEFLVILSYIVASLGSFAGLLMSRHIGLMESRYSRRGFLIVGAITMGISVWAMHFIGMLAVIMPIPVAYDPAITAVSALPAILASAVALHVMSADGRKQKHYIFAGTIIGIGIGAMHYTGMAAMRMDARMVYDSYWFIFSILAAVVLGIVAISTHSIERQVWGNRSVIWLRLVSAGLMGFAITIMHYTAMLATYFFPALDTEYQSSESNVFWLSGGVTVITVIIVSIAIVAVFINRRMQTVENRLQLSQHRLENVIQSLNDGLLMFDSGGKLVMANHVVKDMYPELEEYLKPGTPYDEVLRQWAGMRKQLPGDMDVEQYVSDCLSRVREGREVSDKTDEDELSDGRWIYIRLRPVDDGGMVNIWTDVTPIKELQNLYGKLAHEDQLTGLPNRHMFEGRLKHASAHAARLGKSMSLLYIDLDQFKQINDNFGHAAGDEVLKEVAGRLKDSARQTDTVARLGGDEFAVLLEPYGDQEIAKMVADRILNSLKESIRIGDEECIVGASIGIGIAYIGDINTERSYDVLMKISDTAMYEAKNRSGNAVSITFYGSD